MTELTKFLDIINMENDQANDENNFRNANRNAFEIEESLLHQFSCLGTTDRDELVSQLQILLGNPAQLSKSTAEFFLDMNNWNLQAAIGSYLDVQNSHELPSISFLSNPAASEIESIEPNTEFTKSWHVYNSGAEPWPLGCYIQCTDGHNFSMSRIPLPRLKPTDSYIIHVPMLSPATPGTYSGKWRCVTSSGSYFGDPWWVIVTVVERTTIELTEQLSHFNQLGQLHPIASLTTNPFFGPLSSSSNLTSRNGNDNTNSGEGHGGHGFL